MRSHSKRCGTRGSRAEVMHGNKDCTSGGLTKKDLMYNKHGRIVSRRKHTLATQQKHLVKAGYFAKKGKFGFVRSSKASKTQKSKTKSPKHKSPKRRTRKANNKGKSSN